MKIKRMDKIVDPHLQEVNKKESELKALKWIELNS